MQELNSKHALLEKARGSLKQRFFGIDSAIDQLVDSFGSWYCLSYLQERPLVVNLWGMTGVGKSDLINQLVRELGLCHRYHPFDMGTEKYADGDLESILNAFSEDQLAEGLLFTLDEFQLARTVSEHGNELFRTRNRIVWKLLDDGCLRDMGTSSEKPHIKDFSKCIFFVIGNLDEVYTMHGNQSPDIDPDLFYQQSTEITLPAVKEALKKRFRSEQIARLGNNHIIYPALDNRAFECILEKRLEEISRAVQEKTGISLEVDKGLKEWLLAEGVLGTQGARPLLSTISYTLEDKIPQIIYLGFQQAKSFNVVVLSVSDRLWISYYSSGKYLGKASLPMSGQLEKLKRSRGDDRQALVAVHECGHALGYMWGFGKVPEKLLSVAASTFSPGIMMVESKPVCFSVHQLKAEVLTLLGGITAEKLVFGEDNFTHGASQDIHMMTDLVMQSFKNTAFHGGVPVKYAEHGEQFAFFYHDIKDLEAKALAFIADCEMELRNILERERILLVKLAQFLADHSSMGRKQVERYLSIYGSAALKGKISEERPGYRELLMTKSGKGQGLGLDCVENCPHSLKPDGL